MNKASSSALATLLAICGFASGVFAQDTSATAPQNATPRWALQFSIEDNFQLAAFSGATLSLKRQSSPSRAWRLGITTRFENREQESGSSSRDDLFVSLALPYYRLFYPKPEGVIRPYWGIGIRPALSYQDFDRITAGDITSSGRNTSIGLGLTGAVGVEWYFSESLSILAEYGSILAYTWSDREDKSPTTGLRETSTSVIELDWEQVRFGLTAYW